MVINHTGRDSIQAVAYSECANTTLHGTAYSSEEKNELATAADWCTFEADRVRLMAEDSPIGQSCSFDEIVRSQFWRFRCISQRDQESISDDVGRARTLPCNYGDLQEGFVNKKPKMLFLSSLSSRIDIGHTRSHPLKEKSVLSFKRGTIPNSGF